MSTFKGWEASGRTFDAIVSAECRHWVDPVAGATKAAAVLRPRGLLAVFWNTGQPAAIDGIRAADALDEPEHWRFECAQSYTREEWLDALQTSGSAVAESKLSGLLERVGGAIDARPR